MSDNPARHIGKISRVSLGETDITHLVKSVGHRTIGDMAKSITREIEDRKFLRSIGISSEVDHG